MTKINDDEKKTAVGSNGRSKRKKKITAYARKKTSQTFWNLLRIENNFTLRDVADYTGFKAGTICGWFTGRWMPEDWQIEVLCNMFNLPFEKGKLEMENANTIFHGTHGTIDKEPRKAPEHVVEDVKCLSIKTEPEVKEDNCIDFDAIMRVLFYELSYDEYTEVQKLYPYSNVFSSRDKILKKLFDMLSWESYEKVRGLLK